MGCHKIWVCALVVFIFACMWTLVFFFKVMWKWVCLSVCTYCGSLLHCVCLCTFSSCFYGHVMVSAPCLSYFSSSFWSAWNSLSLFFLMKLCPTNYAEWLGILLELSKADSIYSIIALFSLWIFLEQNPFSQHYFMSWENLTGLSRQFRHFPWPGHPENVAMDIRGLHFPWFIAYKWAGEVFVMSKRVYGVSGCAFSNYCFSSFHFASFLTVFICICSLPYNDF